MNRKKNIIIFRDGLFGDSLISLPALIKLKKDFKDFKIIYISFESNTFKSFRPEKALHFFDVIDQFYFVERIKYIKTINFLKLILILLKEFIKTDLYIVLEHYNSNKTKFLKLFINNKKILSFRDKPTNQNPIFVELYNLVDQYRQNNKESNIVQETKSFLNFKNQKLNDESFNIILAPFTNQFEKKYSLKNYIYILNKLENIYNIKTIIIGTKNEISKKDIKYIKENLKNYNLIVDLPIKKLMQIMITSNMYLGNDTGPMHLAALANLELIVICPHNFQKQYRPISNSLYLFRDEIDFNTYRSKKFPDNNFKPFAETIEPNEILKKITMIIGKNTIHEK